MRPFLLALALTALAGAAPLAGQAAEADVRAVIDRLFDGMRRGDSTAVRSVLHPEVRFQSTTVRDGVPVLRTLSVEAFLRAVGTPHAEVWDERISNVEIRADDRLAAAWMSYSFYLGDKLSHCGVNALQLFHDVGGWRITQIADTRRTVCDGFPDGARPGD